MPETIGFTVSFRINHSGTETQRGEAAIKWPDQQRAKNVVEMRDLQDFQGSAGRAATCSGSQREPFHHDRDERLALATLRAMAELFENNHHRTLNIEGQK